jgi:hypothetical protein
LPRIVEFRTYKIPVAIGGIRKYYEAARSL